MTIKNCPNQIRSFRHSLPHIFGLSLLAARGGCPRCLLPPVNPDSDTSAVSLAEKGSTLSRLAGINVALNFSDFSIGFAFGLLIPSAAVDRPVMLVLENYSAQLFLENSLVRASAAGERLALSVFKLERCLSLGRRKIAGAGRAGAVTWVGLARLRETSCHRYRI